MVKNNTRSTTLEERIQIIEYCIKNDKNYALTAKEFNVSYGQVYNWVRKYNANRPESLLDHRGKCKDKETMTGLELLQIENRMLKAETKKQQMEIDFLKKLEEIERRRFQKGPDIQQYHTINELLNENKGYSITSLCKLGNISRSSYYKWLNHMDSDNDNLNKQIASKIEQMHVEHPDMGYRRLRDALAHDEDINVNDKRVLRICRKKKIQSI